MLKNKIDFEAPARVLSYVVASDTGLAPNVTGDICTLGVCKPVVRRIAEKGDLILGLSIAKDERHKVIYAMQVSEKLSYEAYFKEPRFELKKPIHDPAGDNFFQMEDNHLQIAFDNAAHFGKPGAIKRDLNSPVVLIGERYWYFGEKAPLLPASLHGTKLSLPDRSRRGHRVTQDREHIQQLMAMLNSYETGTHGRPRDHHDHGAKRIKAKKKFKL